MKIAIEAQRIFRSNKHGMDMVVLEMVRCLQKIDKGENEYWIFTAPGPDTQCLQETPNFHIVTLDSTFYPLWEQVLLPRAVKKVGADILHCTSNTAPLFPGAPLVLTLHDVIFLEKKSGSNSSTYQNLGRIYSRFVVPKVLKKCRKVVTVSNYEKKRIIAQTGLPEDKIKVIYNGYGEEFKEDSYEKGGYLFFLGAPNPKKNTSGTLKAYARYLDKSQKKQPLVIADLSGKIVDSYLAEIGRSDIRKFILCPGYLGHDDLPNVYGEADAFLYTSLRESFGIPQLEAMACGTPVIVSNTSALPEIAGEGALLADPLDAEAISNMLVRLEEDEDYRKKAIEYGLERVKKFSWKNTALDALELYRSI